MSQGHPKMGHIQGFKVYFNVLLALCVLTIITVWISRFDFGAFNTIVAMAVATVKASLVVLFFMHGRYENKITWAFIYYPLILLGLLIGGVFLDYGFRDRSMALVKPVSVLDKPHGETGDQAATGGDHGAQSGGDHAAADTTDDGHSAEPEAESQAETPATGPWANLPGDAVAGKTKAMEICKTCHIIDGQGMALPNAPPFEETMAIPEKDPEYLRKWLANPQAIKPGTAMPKFPLSEQEIENLIAFLATYRK